MNIFIHSMALSAAQQWALNEGAGFGRYFDISALDKSWLAEASDDEMSGLHRLPTSPFQVQFTVSKTGQTPKVAAVPSNAVSTVSMILTGISDELRSNLRVAMIAWGITDIDKAIWLANSSVEQRMGLAQTGSITFRLRTSFKRLRLDANDSTSQMACLMKLLSANRTN